MFYVHVLLPYTYPARAIVKEEPTLKKAIELSRSLAEKYAGIEYQVYDDSVWKPLWSFKKHEGMRVKQWKTYCPTMIA